MDIAVVETGGDPGHQPARAAYEAAGFTLLPIARYSGSSTNPPDSDVRVLELHKPAFEAILRERPETALAMMRILCDLLASYAGPTE